MVRPLLLLPLRLLYSIGLKLLWEVADTCA
jgi:hypothetical protein